MNLLNIISENNAIICSCAIILSRKAFDYSENQQQNQSVNIKQACGEVLKLEPHRKKFNRPSTLKYKG